MRPYHLRTLPACSTEGCTKPATVELRNHRNEVISRHCAADGKRRLKDLEVAAQLGRAVTS